MQLKFLTHNAMLIFILASAHAQAQNTFTNGSGGTSGTTGSVDYTIGQVVYTSLYGVSGSVLQGIQQPYEISIITSTEFVKEITLAISTFPNPVKDFLILKINSSIKTNNQFTYYQLFDTNGKLLKNEKIVKNETNIHCDTLYEISEMTSNSNQVAFCTTATIVH